jgi:hypothetical protein
MLASAGLPVPLRGGAHRDFLPLAASVRWLERGEWKSDCVTWSDLYLSTSRGKKFARTLLSFDDIVCADRFTVGSSKWIAEDLAGKICDPGSLLRPGLYAHPGLGLLKERVLDAQAVFKIPQSVAPPEAKNAEIVRALFEESGQASLCPDAVTAELVASVIARTKSMAAIADHLVARAQAATRLMGAAADNIEIFNHRQYLRVNSDAIDKEVRSVSLDFAVRIPGRAADTLTPVARGDVSPRQLLLVL